MENENVDLEKLCLDLGVDQKIYNIVYKQTLNLLQEGWSDMTNKMINDLKRSRIGNNEFIHGIKKIDDGK